jgi:hypothetical protein
MSIALSSLNNLSVYGSDGGTGNQILLMPKLQYRFRVEFLNFGFLNDNQNPLALTRQITDVTRPQVQFDDITLNVYNSRIFMAGKHTWQPITVNVRDDANGQVAKSVGQQLQKQIDFVNQATAASAGDYKFSAIIEILDGGNGVAAPIVLEAWELVGCYLQSANYQTLNYATSDVVTIALTIKYDNAIQTDEGGNPTIGVGQTYARGTSGDLATNG